MLVVPCTAANKPLQCNVQLHWTGHAAASFTRCCCCCGDGFSLHCRPRPDIRRSGT